MSRYNSVTYQKDLQKVIECMNDSLNCLAGKKVLVTGATGLIGAAVIDLLLYYNRNAETAVGLYVASRENEQVRSKFFPYVREDYFHYVPYNAMEEIKLEDAVDYIIHGAGIAYPNIFIQNPVETMQVTLCGTDRLLRYGVEKKIRRMVFISSSEVYGKQNNKKPIKENEYGDIDLLNPRSSYAMGKRAAETMCISYAKEYGLDITIARPGHIYGPTARREDNRVSSMFAYDAADGKNLVLKSNGAQIRSYCYALDCASAILLLLIKGKSGQAYNISNKQSIMSIKEMAEQLAQAADVQIECKIPEEKEKQIFNPMDNSSLESKKLENLGWHGLFDGEKGLMHTVQIIREGKI